MGEHWVTRNRLSQDLHKAVGRASLGRCIGHDFIMRLGRDGFTPDLMFMAAHRLNRQHHWFFDGPADLVIEVLLPEHAQLDQVERFKRYEAAGVKHYWVVDPVQKQVSLFHLTDAGYQQRTLDADGCYRGIEGLTFTAAHLWLPHDQELPVFKAPYCQSNWVTREVEGEDLEWGSLLFQPQVALHPIPIQFEQFVSWCPEAKFEGYGGYYPLIGGRLGTRNALGMLLMSVGLVDTVRLCHPRNWINALQQTGKTYAQDRSCRQQAWQIARTIAHQLHEHHRVEGVGVVGDLLQPHQPWNIWSEISLVVWGVPQSLNLWALQNNWQADFHMNWIQPPYCTPAEWQQVITQMQVLVGKWDASQYQPVRKRLRLFHTN